MRNLVGSLKILPLILFGLVFVAGLIIWQKSQVPANKRQETGSSQAETAIKKVDLATQPQWVQKLAVSARKGISGNGLENVTIMIKGLPKGVVKSVSYVIQYQTNNKGAQGALSLKPVEVNGAIEFSKTIDLGTCSTKSCVRHEGVTAVEIELDFITSSGGQVSWTGNLTI